MHNCIKDKLVIYCIPPIILGLEWTRANGKISIYFKSTSYRQKCSLRRSGSICLTKLKVQTQWKHRSSFLVRLRWRRTADGRILHWDNEQQHHQMPRPTSTALFSICCVHRCTMSPCRNSEDSESRCVTAFCSNFSWIWTEKTVLKITIKCT